MSSWYMVFRLPCFSLNFNYYPVCDKANLRFIGPPSRFYGRMQQGKPSQRLRRPHLSQHFKVLSVPADWFASADHNPGVGCGERGCSWKNSLMNTYQARGSQVVWNAIKSFLPRKSGATRRLLQSSYSFDAELDQNHALIGTFRHDDMAPSHSMRICHKLCSYADCRESRPY